MTKAIIILAIFVVVMAYTEAIRIRCQPMCSKQQQSPIRCVRDSPSHCRKLRQCAIDEENCRRRLLNRPPITSTSLASCRYIKGNVGSGRCAGRIRKPRDSNCAQLPCRDTSPILRCYRSKNNNCRRLTPCQLRRINCHRGWSNALTNADRRQCAGLMPGQIRRCQPIPLNG